MCVKVFKSKFNEERLKNDLLEKELIKVDDQLRYLQDDLEQNQIAFHKLQTEYT